MRVRVTDLGFVSFVKRHPRCYYMEVVGKERRELMRSMNERHVHYKTALLVDDRLYSNGSHFLLSEDSYDFVTGSEYGGRYKIESVDFVGTEYLPIGHKKHEQSVIDSYIKRMMEKEREQRTPFQCVTKVPQSSMWIDNRDYLVYFHMDYGYWTCNVYLPKQRLHGKDKVYYKGLVQQFADDGESEIEDILAPVRHAIAKLPPHSRIVFCHDDKEIVGYMDRPDTYQGYKREMLLILLGVKETLISGILKDPYSDVLMNHVIGKVHRTYTKAYATYQPDSEEED